MSSVTRRNFVKAAAARAWRRRAPAEARVRRRPAQGRHSSISGRSATTAGPGRMTKAARRWSTRFNGKVTADYVENVKEDASAIPILKDLAQQGHKLIFATSYGYMDQTRRSRQAVPERDVRALHRLQARRQPRHLQLALPSGPRGRRHDRRHDVEVRHDRLSRLLQGAGSRAGRERLHARRAGAEPEDHHQARHDQLVVRPGEGSGRRPDADQPRLRRHRPAHRQPGGLQVCEQRKVWCFGQGADMSRFAPKTHLTAIEDIWGPYYISRAKAMLDGSWKSDDAWWGMKEGTVVISPYNKAMPENVRAAADKVIAGWKDGTYDVFTGPISDQSGKERVAKGERIKDGDALVMDWYVKGVQS